MRIYRIRNTVTGDVYIGSESRAPGSRRRSHLSKLRHRKHHSPYLQNAFNKYGEGAFCFETVEDGIEDYAVLTQREQHYIDTVKPAYNAAPAAGCLRGFKRSAETRRKHSQTISGRTLTAEHKTRIGAANKGKVRSPEFRAFLSARAKAQTYGPSTRMKLAAATRASWDSPAGIQRRAAMSARVRAYYAAKRQESSNE